MLSSGIIHLLRAQVTNRVACHAVYNTACPTGDTLFGAAGTASGLLGWTRKKDVFSILSRTNFRQQQRESLNVLHVKGMSGHSTIWSHLTQPPYNIVTVYNKQDDSELVNLTVNSVFKLLCSVVFSVTKSNLRQWKVNMSTGDQVCVYIWVINALNSVFRY